MEDKNTPENNNPGAVPSQPQNPINPTNHGYVPHNPPQMPAAPPPSSNPFQTENQAQAQAAPPSAQAPRGNPFIDSRTQANQQMSAQPVQPAAEINGEYHSQPFASAAFGLGRLLSRNPVSAITVSFIVALIVFALYILSVVTIFTVLANDSSIAAGALFSVATILVILLVLIRAISATAVLYVSSENKEKVTGRSALFKRSSEKIGAFLVASIIYVGVVMIGLLLFVLPGIYLAVKLSLYPFAIYDEKLSGLKSLKRSWSLTKGHFFETMGALTAQAFLTGNGLLSLSAGMSGAANRYFELKALESGRLRPVRTHWLNFALPVLAVALIGIAIISSVSSSSTQQLDFDDFDFESNQSELNNNGFNSFQGSFDGTEFQFETDLQ